MSLESSRNWKRNNKEKVREYRKIYYKENQDKERQTHKDWIRNNPEKKKEYDKKFANSELGKETIKAIANRNKSKRNKRERERYKDEPQYRIDKILRATFNQALDFQRVKKTKSLEKLVGCSREALVAHIENKFTEGMSWDLMGQIHIDHIRPCASFDLTDPEQQKRCFHYTNLQPLWAKDNLIKSDKYEQTSI